MISWILSLMMYLQPVAPWVETYQSTANAIAKHATQTPLFQGKQATEKTAALLVSLAWFESRFDPNALGDHGISHGLFQQQGLGLLVNPDDAVAVAISQIKLSFRICASKVIEERLGWYAAGGNGCDSAIGLKQSRHRMLKAVWLLGKFPYKEQ